MNKTKLVTFLFVLWPLFCHAQTYFKASEKIPSDVGMALNFLQTHSSFEVDREDELKELDQLLGKLTEEERLMILKSEFYKAVLKTSRGVPVQRSSYRRETLERLKKSFEDRNPENWNELSEVFIQALIKDLEIIMQDVNYPNFLNQLNSRRALTSQSRSFKQRLDNLLPWVQWYFEGSLPGLEQKLLQTSELGLQLITQRVKNLIFMSEFESEKSPSKAEKLSFFEAAPHPKASQKEEKSAEETIEGIDVESSAPAQKPLDEKYLLYL